MRSLLIALLLGICSLAQAEEFEARVIAVMDGDTLMVLRGSEKIKIRLVNIDAPEKSQAYGKESRDALLASVLKKQVRVSSQAVDNYGRMIAEIHVNGRSVNEEMVASGMAWEYSHFHRNKHYLALQSAAQQAHLGLWSQTDKPVPPELWRKQHPASGASVKRNEACGSKRYCSQMLSCVEAKFYLTQCGVKSLDGNGDGVPCEALCAAELN